MLTPQSPNLAAAKLVVRHHDSKASENDDPPAPPPQEVACRLLRSKRTHQSYHDKEEYRDNGRNSSGGASSPTSPGVNNLHRSRSSSRINSLRGANAGNNSENHPQPKKQKTTSELKSCKCDKADCLHCSASYDSLSDTDDGSSDYEEHHDNHNAKRRPLQDINDNGDSSLSSEHKPGRRLKAEYTASARAKQILEQFASSEFLRNASSHLLNALIPDIDKATGENKVHIEYLYTKIEDHPEVLDRLLRQYEFHNMEHHLSELSAELEREGILMERGWMDNTVAKFIAQGRLAVDNNQNIYVLKGCKEEEDDEDLVNKEDSRSLFGVNGDPWILMPNPNERSSYTGVRVTRNDVYDKNSKADRLSSQIIGYEYNRVTGYNASPNAAQCGAFYGEKLGELWMMASFPDRTMNRNCYYCLSSRTTRSCHETGVLRVDRDAIENGLAGYYKNWSETVLRAIGASDEQLLTLEPHKSGEPYSPDAYYNKNYTMLYNYWVKEGKPEGIWVVDPIKCEDYDEKKKSSKMYDYWSSLFGLTSQQKIELQQWQQDNLAAIWIHPDQVELVRKAQTQRRTDQQLAKMQAKMQAIKDNISKRK